MATPVGKLVATLGLDAGDYFRGLTKAEQQAKNFARNFERDVSRAVAQVAKILGTLEVGRQVFINAKDIVEQAASLSDLADATGSTVESLSALSNQAKVAGTDFNTLQGMMLKLSAGMAGADDESSKVGAALKYLGITTRDPAEALQQVAKRLNEFEDGVGKVGLAVALFGKQGGAFLATLKDMAEAQDVQGTVTARQAQEAEALQKQIARLSVESEGFKNAILSGVVPVMTRAIEQFREGTKAAGGFWEALRLFGTLNPFDTPAEGIAKLRAQIDDLQNQKAKGETLGDRLRANLGLPGLDARIADASKQLEFLKFQQRQAALLLIDPSNNDARDFKAGQKPPVTFKLPGGKDGGGKDRVSEAQRFLEALQKQLLTTQDLSTEERVLAELQSGRIEGLTPALREQIVAVAQQIDAYKELERWINDSRKAHEDEARAAKQAADELAKKTKAAEDEAERQLETNERLRDEIAIILGGDNARKALERDYLARALARKEDALATAQQTAGMEGVARALEVEIEALRERQGLLDGRDAAEKIAEESKQIAQLQSDLFDIAGNAVEDLAVNGKKASDVLKSLEKDLLSFFARAALANIKNALLGGSGGGGDFFSIIAKLIGGFGGGSGGGIGFSGGGFGEHFATGGVSRGGLAMVGEQGPELVNLPRGASVMNASKTRRALTPPMTFNVNVMPGANTQSARQAAGVLRDAVLKSIRER